MTNLGNYEILIPVKEAVSMISIAPYTREHVVANRSPKGRDYVITLDGKALAKFPNANGEFSFNGDMENGEYPWRYCYSSMEEAYITWRRIEDSVIFPK